MLWRSQKPRTREIYGRSGELAPQAEQLFLGQDLQVHLAGVRLSATQPQTPCAHGTRARGGTCEK